MSRGDTEVKKASMFVAIISFQGDPQLAGTRTMSTGFPLKTSVGKNSRKAKRKTRNKRL